MKNIFRVALLTALACLLCFSCTNINDPEALTADKFTVNKMKVEGFYVEGLADDYDQKTVQLMYAVKDKDNKEQSTLIAEANVAGIPLPATGVAFTTMNLEISASSFVP